MVHFYTHSQVANVHKTKRSVNPRMVHFKYQLLSKKRRRCCCCQIRAGTKTFPLSEVIELDTPGAGFRSISDLRDLVGAPRKNPGGAPNLYGDLLTVLIKDRIAEKIALYGRNAEARAVLADFKRANPDQKSPSLSSVQDYVTKVRAGQ